jgi:hypothetical protein
MEFIVRVARQTSSKLVELSVNFVSWRARERKSRTVLINLINEIMSSLPWNMDVLCTGEGRGEYARSTVHDPDVIS